MAGERSSTGAGGAGTTGGEGAAAVPTDGHIRLGQLLKLASLVETGADAKEALAAGAVRVNGEVEVRRGRQLSRGDVVEVEGAAPVRVD